MRISKKVKVMGESTELAKLIDEAVDQLNWKQIIDFYNKFPVKWEVIDDKGKVKYTTPSEEDLRQEVRSLLFFAVENDIDFVEFNNWLLYVERLDEDKDEWLIEVIFQITSTLTSNSEEYNTQQEHQELDRLNQKLNALLESEDYEEAAKVRDEIKNLIEKK